MGSSVQGRIIDIHYITVVDVDHITDGDVDHNLATTNAICSIWIGLLRIIVNDPKCLLNGTFLPIKHKTTD